MRRRRRGYPTDLTDAQWAAIAELVPEPLPGGRPRRTSPREVINAILYMLRGGQAWRLLPDSFPPWRTVYRWFARLRDGGVLEALNHHLVILDRERTEREASPTAAVIDSQSTKTTEAGGPRGYDAGKKVMGRRRHAMVDTDGRAPVLHAHPGSVQDRDGAPPLLRASRRRWPFVALAFADAGYAGEHVANASPIRIEIIRKLQGQVGLPPRGRWLKPRRPCAPLGGRALLRVDRPQPPPREGLRGLRRVSRSLPLRRLHHAPATTPRPLHMRFETDSEVGGTRWVTSGSVTRPRYAPRSGSRSTPHADRP